MSWIRRLGRALGIGRRRWIEDAEVREEHTERVRTRLEEAKADASRARRTRPPDDQLAISEGGSDESQEPPSQDR